MPASSDMEFSQVALGCPGVQTRERGHDEVLEDGSSQSRSPVQALLERHMSSRQSLAARIWANGVGKGGQGEWPLFFDTLLPMFPLKMYRRHCSCMAPIAT